MCMLNDRFCRKSKQATVCHLHQDVQEKFTGSWSNAGNSHKRWHYYFYTHVASRLVRLSLLSMQIIYCVKIICIPLHTYIITHKWSHYSLTLMKCSSIVIIIDCPTYQVNPVMPLQILYFNLRHPEGSCRPTFPEVLDSLLQPESELLYWKPAISEDSDSEGVHSTESAWDKSAILGAPLKAGEQLYPELQCTYMSVYEAVNVPLQ